jgi:hypothetical protein
MEQINRKDLGEKCIKIQRVSAALCAFLLVCFYIFGEIRAEIECSHPSLPEGLAAMASTDAVSVRTIEVTMWPGSTDPAPEDDNIYFAFEPKTQCPVVSLLGEPAPTIGLIIHPGGNCDPRAYAPMAQAIASEGYLVAILPMPNCISIRAGDRTAQVIEDFANIKTWVLAGHSVGGASISQYAYEHGGIAGLVMLAALGHKDYPLDDTHNVEVLSLYGGNDTHLTPEMILVEYAYALPADTEYVKIEGGNHTQFGWLDPTPYPEYFDGDGPADITYQQQQDIVVAYILDFLHSFDDNEEVRQVKILRRFRDEILAKSTAGKRLIGHYYLHAGTITQIFDSHPTVRGPARWVLKSLVPILDRLL